MFNFNYFSLITDISFLERLMKLDMYKNKDNENYVVKLVKNYRSHKDIIKISSEAFYDGELTVILRKSLFIFFDILEKNFFLSSINHYYISFYFYYRLMETK